MNNETPLDENAALNQIADIDEEVYCCIFHKFSYIILYSFVFFLLSCNVLLLTIASFHLQLIDKFVTNSEEQ